MTRDNAEFATELDPLPPFLPSPSPTPETHSREQQHHDDEEMRDQSPKLSPNSARSSETMGAETPPQDSPIGSVGSVLPADGTQDIGSLLPPIEMTERGGHIAPVVKAVHLRPTGPGGKISDVDDDEMSDVQHIEMSDSQPEEEERKGG